MSNPRTIPKKRLGFSYICLEDYELYQNFDDTELKERSNFLSNDKVNFLQKGCGH